MDNLIGKLAYKKRGFFSGIVGVIQKNNNGISPYKLIYKSTGAVGFHDENDIVLVEEDTEKE